jgi:nucleoside-diphosphate-sugar epimerase
MQRCEALDISRAREELGFEPIYSVEDGIKKYADWMKEVMK